MEINMENICASLYEKNGGFIKGVCHPNDDYKLLKDAGLFWVRRDIPYPFEADGSVSESYKNYKERCIRFAENGIKHITVTPYPSEFLRHGIDVTTAEGLEKAAEVCEFITRDYKDIKTCWQITNEMHIRHFRAPLNASQAKDFLIACIKGAKKGDPNAAVGHNSLDREWVPYCLEIEEKTGGCDYAGIDIYDGTWSFGGVDTISAWVDEVYDIMKKPVILMEFGFASRGGIITDIESESQAFAKEYGYDSFKDVLNDIEGISEKLPPRIKKNIMTCVPEDREGTLMASLLHVVKKWYTDCTIPHDEDGQAQFYSELLPKLLEKPHLGGAVLYCLSDSKACFFCGGTDCPCETAWGLIRVDGSLKPSYEAVKNVFAK